MRRYLPYIAVLAFLVATPAEASVAAPPPDAATARAATDEGRWNQALVLWKAVSDAHPDDPTAAAELGWAQMETGQTPDAKRAFNRVLRLDPGNVRAQAGLVKLAILALNPDEALRLARDAVKQAPGSAAAWRMLGDAQRAASHRSEAEDAYRQAVTLDPNNAEGHAGLGETLLTRNKNAEAFREFRTAVRLAPTNAAYQDGLARAAFAAGEYGAAALADATAMEIALKPTPDWPRLDNLAQNAMDALGRASAALRNGSESRETVSDANTKILAVTDAIAALPAIENADIATHPAMAQRALAYDLMGQAAASDLAALRNGSVSESSDAFVFREQARRALVSARAAVAAPS